MKYKTNIEVPDVECYVPNLRAFYSYVYARHSIWYNRFIKKLPREEWTTDPILRKSRYTNCYRELDRGTIWMFDNIIMKSIHNKGKSNFNYKRDLIWKICVYRLLNKVETFDKVGLLPFGDMDSTITDSWFSALRELLEEGFKVWTSAHITLQCNLKQDRLTNYEMILRKLNPNMDDITKVVMEATNTKQVWDRLMKEYGFGPFISYEVATDLAYCSWTEFDTNDWANAGPGCIPGINLIFPRAKRQTEYMEKMVLLRDAQQQAFKKLKLDFESIRWDGQWLSLRNVEHSLCEFRKFHNEKNGEGRPRPKFNPITVVK